MEILDNDYKSVFLNHYYILGIKVLEKWLHLFFWHRAPFCKATNDYNKKKQVGFIPGLCQSHSLSIQRSFFHSATLPTNIKVNKMNFLVPK